MRDLNLVPPNIGERVSRRYLQGLQDLAGHFHSPSLGMTGVMGVAEVPADPTDSFRIYTCELTTALNAGSSATATMLIGLSKATSGDTITVYDTPAFITAGKKLPIGTKLRVFKDHDMDLGANEYVVLTSSACEVDQ